MIDFSSRPVTAVNTSVPGSASPAQTPSTASSSNPPANTDERAHSSRSGSSHRSNDHWMQARSVCCRAGAPRLPRDSSANRSASRSSICCGARVWTRAAASSIANGSPSRRRQSSAIASAFASVSAQSCTAARARAANNVTASQRLRSAGVSRTPGAGVGSGGTG
jgi:hypothetical protein